MPTRGDQLLIIPASGPDVLILLPGFMIAGIAALRDRVHGLFWLGPWLVFSALMGASIVAAMVLMITAGATNAAPALVMVSLVVAASLYALWGYLKQPTTT
mgnify:CR=1 FL=1